MKRCRKGIGQERPGNVFTRAFIPKGGHRRADLDLLDLPKAKIKDLQQSRKGNAALLQISCKDWRSAPGELFNLAHVSEVNHYHFSIKNEFFTMNRLLLFLSAVTFLVASCTKQATQKESWQPLDLLGNGIPVTILAPDSATVSVTRVGMVEDVAISKPAERYGLQIYVQPVFTNDLPALKSNQVEEVKSTAEFQKILEEDENGFLFSLRSGDAEYYSFRYIHLQADKEYIFTTAFNEQFTLGEAKRMMDAVKNGLTHN